MNSSNAFNKDTRSLFSPLVDDSPSKVKLSPTKKVINPKFITKIQTKNKSIWNQHDKSKIQRLKSEGRHKVQQEASNSIKHSQSIDMDTMDSPAMNSTFT